MSRLALHAQLNRGKRIGIAPTWSLVAVAGVMSRFARRSLDFAMFYLDSILTQTAQNLVEAFFP